MNEKPPNLILPNQPKIVVPGQQPAQESPMATVKDVLSMFATFGEFMCDNSGSDNIEFELKGSDGTPALIHFSRGKDSNHFKKWINKAKIRLNQKQETQGQVVPLFEEKVVENEQS